MSGIHSLTNTPWCSAVIRGFRRRCPRCGMGKLFKSYLKTPDTCSVCCLNFKNINHPGDGPAFFTMSIVLFCIVPVLLWIDIRYNISMTFLFLTGIPFTLIAALLVLPRVKGAFIAASWKAKPEDTHHD